MLSNIYINLMDMISVLGMYVVVYLVALIFAIIFICICSSVSSFKYFKKWDILITIKAKAFYICMQSVTCLIFCLLSIPSVIVAFKASDGVIALLFVNIAICMIVLLNGLAIAQESLKMILFE